jgi:hypothetical protein
MQIPVLLLARRVQSLRQQMEGISGNLKQAARQIFFSEFHLLMLTPELPLELAGRSWEQLMAEAAGALKPVELQCRFTESTFKMLIRAQQLEIAVRFLERRTAETIGDLKRAKQLTICGMFPSLTQTMELPLVREAQL